MFKHYPNLIAFRGFTVVAACLALLGGCGTAAINSAANKSTADKSATTVPVTPASLAAVAGDAVVTLTWTASTDATGYHVKRATSSGGPYTQVSAPSSPAYTDTSVTNGATYYYVVSALDSAGESANSAQVSATPETPSVPPAAPANLTATAGNAQVSLTWTASSGATSYDVKRSIASGGPYTQLAATTSPSYTDATVSNGTIYYYVVAAANSAGESADSAVASVTPDPTITTPGIPMGLQATAGNAQVSLTWSASSGASSYHVKRATTSGGPYTQVGAPTSPSYTDTSVTNGTTYYYVVSALDSAGESANSAQVSALPVAPTAIPAVPAGLSATPGNAQVSLTWSASSGATSYHVKRATTSGGPYTQVGAPTSSAYTDISVTNGATYYYVVSALDSAGESANSAQVRALPVAATSIPTVPSGLSATPGNGLVTLSWSPSSGATSYNLKRATTSGGPYTQVGGPTSPAYTDTSATNGTTYYYVVSALDSAGESANSAQVSALPVAPTAIPAAPAGLSATPGNGLVTLSWSPSSGATSYHLKRATTSGGPYTQVGGPTSPAYTDTSVTNGTTYYYVVSALDSAGESANSAQVSALPVPPIPPPTTFGTWINVTPSNANLTDTLSCSNYGTETVQADTANPSNLYTEFNCQGIWKSTDYGATWAGPINTGANAAKVSDCAGGITISPSDTAGGVPTIYESCIRGTGIGFWKSVDGGVNWTNYSVAPPMPTTQDVYPPVVDPYNSNHLLMAAHEQNYLLESTDGGHTWSSVNLASGMTIATDDTAAPFFINTGDSSTTHNTWLWISQITGGTVGTWRTTNGGTSWTKVDNNEHNHGSAQTYQPDTSGVFYMAGDYSALGAGVLRSTDYGQTWTFVGSNNPGSGQTVVTGTSKNIYAMFSFAIGIGGTYSLNFELAAQPGTGTWTLPGTPAGLTQGAAQIAVVNDGTHNILVGAMWNGGVWRYIEP